MTINAMSVSAGDAYEVLKSIWDMQKASGVKLSTMLHGRPGIGKTQIVEQLARYIGGKLYDIRLTQIDTSDLRGLPYYDHETKTTKWYRPEDLPATDEPAVLFLDEITAASPFLTPTVYGLLQERRVGMHKIPDNTIIIAAGNTVDDGAVAYEMNTAISDRLVHMHVKADAEDWLKSYAVPNKLHPAVTAFLKVRGDLLENSEQAREQGHMIATTPRSWDRASTIMYNFPDRRQRMIMLSGTLGESVTADFMVVADDIAATVQVSKMLETPRAKRAELYPTNMYGLNAMVFGLVGSIKPETIDPIMEILVDLGQLASLRPNEDDLKALPLPELMTHGFETVLQQIYDRGGDMVENVLNSKIYQDYYAERQEAGLEL